MIRKTALLPLLIVCLVASPALSQAIAPNWAAKLFDNDFVHTTLIHDFGTVAAGAVAKHRFQLGNPYLEDIKIDSATSTCGCTSLDYDKTKGGLLKTYETNEIVAELDTRRFTGIKESTINVTVSYRPKDPARGFVSTTIQLKIRAYIRKDIVFEPGAVQFGTVQPGQAAEKHVTLKYAGRANWRIVEAISPAPYLALSLKEIARTPDPRMAGTTDVDYDLVVSLKGTAPAGYFNDQITLKTDDQDQQTARVPLAVQGYVVPGLSVTPTLVMLGEVKPGQSAAKTLVVRGAKPFRITSVSGPDDQFHFTKASEAKEVQVVGVQFIAGTKPGKITGKIHITTDMDGVGVDADVDGQIVAGDSPASVVGAGAMTPERAKIDSVRPGPAGFSASSPGGNVLRPSRLKPVEPDAVTPQK